MPNIHIYNTADTIVNTINHTGALIPFILLVTHIVKVYTECMSVDRQGIERATPLLRMAIEKLQYGRPMLLTSLHAPFALACLKGQKYLFAEPIIVNIPCDIDSGDKLDSKSVLSYFYYAGVLALALERYDKALELLITCFAIPAACLSAIHVEAYKKFILTSIIVKGEVVDFPRGSPSALSRHLPAICPAYKAIADSVKESLSTSIDEHQATLIEDKNLGLARMAIHWTLKRKVKKLTNTFKTLQLEDIAKLSGLANASAAEQLLASMVARREIFAVIDLSNGLVKFLDDPETYSSFEFCRSLQSKFIEGQAILQEAQKLNEEISLNPHFIEKGLRREARRGSTDSAFGSGEGTDPELEMALAASMNI